MRAKIKVEKEVDLAVAYNDGSFQEKAMDLRNLAYAQDEQL